MQYQQSEQKTAKDAKRRFALTVPQIPIWLDQSAYPRKPIYNTGQTVTLQVPLVIDQFVEALNRVISENDALRLRFTQCDDEVFQEVVDDVAVDLDYQDFSGENIPEQAAQAWIERLFWEPVEPNDFPLFKFAIAKLASDRFLWLQKYHHLIIDAAGRQRVAARAAEIYESLSAKTPIVDPDLGTYGNLADVEVQYLASHQSAVDEAYWQNRFADLPEPLIHGDPRLSERGLSGRPVRLTCDVSDQTSQALRALARKHKSTLFRVVLCLAHSYFSRTYGNSDIVFGVPVANRETSERTAGLFAKVMPFRMQLSQTTTFADALSSISRDLRDDLEHGRFPSHRINRLARLSGYDAESIYNVIVNYQRFDYTFKFGGSPVTCSNLSVGFSAPWAITVFEHGPNSPLEIAIEFDPGRVERDEAIRFARCFEVLLRQAPGCSDISVGRLPMVSAEEQVALLLRGQGERVALPADATLATLFNEQAARLPEAIALICGEQRLTYLELNAQAEELARKLVVLGVGPESVVGISLPRSSILVVAILAIHKAGGAYLPLDPNYPHDRLVFMLDDANAKVIVTQRAQAALFEATSAQLLLLDERALENTAGRIGVELPSRTRPDNLAYIIYTSGSTGRPKGVALTQGSAVNMVLSSRADLGEEDISGVLLATSLNFDMSVYEIFLPLAFGGAIILVDSLAALATAPAKYEVSLVSTVPSLITGFLARASLPSGVRVINLVGETLPRHVAEAVFKDRPGVRIFNIYGPTEVTTYSTRSRIDPSDRRPPPIGIPIRNTDHYVVDEHGELVPDGAVGELWIGGAGVSRGYVGRAELTEERFAPNPFGRGRIYKTGDLVRWLADGQLGYCGRSDQQVKIKGVRIEPGEIEEHLRVHAAISEAVVTASEQEGGQKGLVAYLLSRPGMARPDGRSLRTHLAATLPTQLIPASFVWLDALPRTSSGKIDRKALPHARGIALEPVEHIGGEARNNVEQAALEIWRDWFKDDRIGVCDNYFDLGGDSLDAFWLISKCNKRFGTSLPLSSLFTHPTVEHLALAIDAALTGSGGKKQQRKSGSDTRPLLVLMPGAAGDNRTLVRFRGALEEKLRFLVIEYPSWLDMVDAKGSLDAIVDSAIGQIRAIFGKDTCFLAGYSFGGVVAYEVASRLWRSGHPVGFLGLIDTKLSSQSPKLPVIEQGIQRWRMNRGVVGRLQMIILALLRFRAFSLLRIFSRLLMSLPLRLTADFHTMLVTQLQRHARMDWVPDPLQTPTVLFRAGEDAHEKERDYGWSQVCERLKIVPIGGDHVSILTPPDAEILQASLLAEVQEAYSNAQSTVGVAVPQSAVQEG